MLRHLLNPSPWAAALVAFGVLLLSVTGQSIGLEEAQVWQCLRAETPGEFFTQLASHPRSESQMPLGLFVMWSWTRASGLSEWGMRSINLIWAALALLALARAGERLSLGWLPLLFAVQPFVWFSMDHAGTTMMQMAGGSLLLVGTLEILASRAFRGIGVPLFCGGAILVCGASLFGSVVVVAVVFGISLHRLWRRMEMTPRARITLFATSGVIALLVGYWLAVLWRGAGPLRLWPVTPANLGFTLYELLGFLGLGPGKVDLRLMAIGERSWGGVLAWLPALGVLASAYAVVFGAAYKAWLTRPFERIPGAPAPVAAWLAGMGVPGLSLALLFLLSVATGFVFWGRQLAGAFPFWILALALTMRWAGQGLWRRAGRIGCAVLWTAFIASSASIRLAPQHGRIDYRTASSQAQDRADSGSTVYWFADESAGEYYGLVFPEGDFLPEQGAVLLTANATAFPGIAADAVFLSRPENYDRGDLTRAVAARFNLQATVAPHGFMVWQRERPQ